MMNETEEALVDQAVEAFEKAYAPYSNYPVGAAVLTDERSNFYGINVENAVYPLTICGERVAIFKAVSKVKKRLRRLQWLPGMAARLAVHAGR